MWHNNLTVIVSYYYTVFQYVAQQSDSQCQLLLFSLTVCGTTIWQSLSAITIQSSSMWHNNLTVIVSYYYTVFQYVAQQSDSHFQLLLYSLPVCGTTIWQSLSAITIQSFSMWHNNLTAIIKLYFWEMKIVNISCVLDTTLCDKICQWLATGRWFSPDPPVSSINKTDIHDIAVILLKVALNTINLAITLNISCATTIYWYLFVVHAVNSF
jgi:hypothetical protein